MDFKERLMPLSTEKPIQINGLAGNDDFILPSLMGSKRTLFA